MMRVTPLRFTTLQCSQMGFTLLRTFTGGSETDRNCGAENRTRPQEYPNGPLHAREPREQNADVVRDYEDATPAISPHTRSIAASGSGAAVTARPSTKYVAPASTAPPGVITRDWS
jgi:hypothetical protein